MNSPDFRLAAPAAEAVHGLAELCGGLNTAYFAMASRVVAALLHERDLPERFAPPAGDSYTRTLLHADPMGRFGIWMLWWPPGSMTPIHDHNSLCVFGVCLGEIEERHYSDVRDGKACETFRALRRVGFVGGAPLEKPSIHRMTNPGAQPAASIHLYGYDPATTANSIRRCFGEA